MMGAVFDVGSTFKDCCADWELRTLILLIVVTILSITSFYSRFMIFLYFS